jgi:hypothetical protein
MVGPFFVLRHFHFHPDFQFHSENTMDKKAKKRLEVLRQKVQKAEQLLAAAKQQTDEPDEIQNIEKQIAGFKAEIDKIKNS